MIEEALRLLIEEMPFAINSLTLRNFKTNNCKIFTLDIKKTPDINKHHFCYSKRPEKRLNGDCT